MYHGAAFLAEIVDRHDVRVIEPAGGLRLAAEAVDQLRRVLVGELVLADRLERDHALDHRVVRLVDDAHRAAPDLAPDLVLADVIDFGHASLLTLALDTGDAASECRRRSPLERQRPWSGYLYFWSISHTFF